MGSHRRFVSSETGDEYATGLQPEHALESYGAVRMGARPAYGIATNLRDEQKDPSAKGFLDWFVGGFEDEDAAASPTVGGMDIKTGKPMSPSSANVVVEQLNKDRDKLDIFSFFRGDDDKPKGPDWKKIAIVVGVLGGGYVVWSKVIEPKLAQRKAGG
jgi:hypothetical protein